MPVVFGPTLRRLTGEEQDEAAVDADHDASAPSRRTLPVTTRRAALGAVVAGIAAWLAARRLRTRRSESGENPEPSTER